MLRAPVPDAAWEQQRHNCPTIHNCHLPTVPLTLGNCPPMLSVFKHSLTPEYSPSGAGGWINPRCRPRCAISPQAGQLNPSSFQSSSSESTSLLLTILARFKSIFKQSASGLAPPTDDRSGTGLDQGWSSYLDHLRPPPALPSIRHWGEKALRSRDGDIDKCCCHLRCRGVQWTWQQVGKRGGGLEKPLVDKVNVEVECDQG